MKTPTLLPSIAVRAEVATELDELATRRLIEPARRAGYELHVIGTSPLPKRGELVIVQSHPADNWLIVDPRDDPSASAYGGKQRIPAAIRQRLTALDAAGVHPDHTLIAHELPKGWREGHGLENLIPAPRPQRELDELLSKRIRTVVDASAKAAKATTVGLGELVASALDGLDPVLFGGIQHPREPVVAWLELARWRWE